MAKKEKYTWKIGEEVPKIDDHSIVKLDIISEYIEIYLEFLSKNFHTSSLKLTLVDGFSGGGIYQNDIFGSPIRLRQAVEKSTQIIKFKREQNGYKPISFDIDFKFIEKNKNSFLYLKKTLNEFGFMCDKTQCICGEFGSNLQKIIDEVRSKSKAQRVIFILDQYGYSDAPIRDVNKIFSELKNTEVILTFSVDSLIDYLSESNSPILKNLGLTKLQIEELLDAKQDSDSSRATIQPLLYKSIVEQSGAPYFTPFFIKSDVSNRSYWLFHFSSHPTARNEMMKLHWKHQNTFQHFGKPGINMLIGYDSEWKHHLFQFDDLAKNESILHLSEELPKLIHSTGRRISFSELYNSIANDTPATAEIIKEALAGPMDSGEISIIGKNEKSRRFKHSTIDNSDYVIYTGRKQGRLI
jgi:three-Cys-motif partner protein